MKTVERLKRQITNSKERRRAYRSCLAVCFVAAAMTGCAMQPGKPFARGIGKTFQDNSIVASASGEAISFEQLVEDLAHVQVVYVGEQHTNPHHHNIQLRIMKAIIGMYPETVVGMEMFAHPYQDRLDQWSKGELDQNTFLEKVHWYVNWKYDFKLYKDILDFIRDQKTPLVGLNLPFHIPPKIRVGGLENLLDSEKKHLPGTIDTSNSAHRIYLMEAFKVHHGRGMDNFEFFYQAQCAWEDGMAESIAATLKNGKMIVFVGNGHIIYKYGIPDRAFRRTGASFRTVYLAAQGEITDLAVADYIWVTPSEGLTRDKHGPSN